jgi:N-acetylglucosamine-6-phosphate deacetylase
MKDLYLMNCDVVLGDGVAVDSAVAVRDGIIEEIGGPGRDPIREVDLDRAAVYPGFIDIHCHGADGVDVNSSDANGIERASAFLARHGVTGWVPTLVPDADEVYASAVSAIEENVGSAGGARVLGVHYEGLYANSHRCGALRTEYFRNYPDRSFGDLPVPSSGAKLMTFAPECGDGVLLAADLLEGGWLPFIGHTEASVDVLEAAFDAGARHVTHLFNAMTGLHHRDLGVAGWALTRKGVSFDIIADGHHIAPPMVRMAIVARGTGNAVLISDSMALAGLPEGRYELWGREVEVVEGMARTPSGTISGSVITMLDAVNLCLSLGFSPQEVSTMASLNPARILGLRNVGTIKEGYAADLVAVRDGRAVLTIVGGEVVHEEL